MNKLLLYILFILCLISCNRNTETDRYQANRNNKIDVKQLIKEIKISEEDVLIGNYALAYVSNKYLLIEDLKSFDYFVSVFDKNKFSYLGSVGKQGQGPKEISNPGAIAIDDTHGKFYINDHSKMRIFSFDIDSALKDPANYKPNVKVHINSSNFPTEYEYINDTLCVGRTIAPIGINDYTPSVSKWNMLTGEIVPLSNNTPKIKHKRIVCASSAKYTLAAEIYTYHNLISIFDFNGNLKCNIYGPEWSDKSSRDIHYYGGGVFCKGSKFIVSYSGGSNKGNDYYPKQLIVFDLDGNYIKTLDIGYMINQFCYDEGNNRLIFVFNDEIQFGYLDLEGVI